jgi:hypothetical protein
VIKATGWNPTRPLDFLNPRRSSTDQSLLGRSGHPFLWSGKVRILFRAENILAEGAKVLSTYLTPCEPENWIRSTIRLSLSVVISNHLVQKSEKTPSMGIVSVAHVTRSTRQEHWFLRPDEQTQDSSADLSDIVVFEKLCVIYHTERIQFCTCLFGILSEAW